MTTKIKSDLLDDGSVTGPKLGAGAVSTDKFATGAKAPLAGTADFSLAPGWRNKLINPNFSINQRGVVTGVTLAAGEYGHDRWKAGAGGCTYLFSTTNNVTTITITAGTLQQVIEGANLQSGTHVLSWAGTAQARIDSGAYGASGLTATLTGGANATVEFGTGSVALAQLEPGSTVSQFEHRFDAVEMALCRRYYYQTSNQFTSYQESGVLFGQTIHHPVTMRASPTAVLSNQSYTNASGAQAAGANATSYRFVATAAATGVVDVASVIRFSAEL